MIGRRLATLVLAVTLLASGGYVAVYLVRWEWQRATFSAMVFLAAQAALSTLWLARQLRRATPGIGPAATPSTAARPDHPPALAEQRLRAALDTARPTRSKPFAWLAPSTGQLGVFIPLLLGAGVLLSGLAWVIERIAAAVARPGQITSMAAGLAALTPPPRLISPAIDPSWAYRPGGWSALSVLSNPGAGS